MTAQLFISLLNPAVALLLSSAFVVLWYHRREAYVMMVAVAFANCAAGFVVQDIAPPPDFAIGRLISNGLFSISIVTICAAFISRYRGRIPYVTWSLMLIAGGAGLVWFIYVDPRPDIRIYIFNATFFGVVAMTGIALRDAFKLRNVVDYLVVGLILSSLLSLVLRPLLVVWDSLPYRSDAGFQESVYWATVQFAAVFVSVAVALTLLVAVTLQLIAELRVESHTDQLSGVLNRRGFEEAARQALARSRAAARPSVLIMADLDNFKSINDQFGHAAGDAVIADFAKTLRLVADSRAVIGRVGGEEFAMFLPDGNQSSGRVFAEQVRAEFAASVVPGLPDDVRPSASFGIRVHDGDEQLQDMMRGSDKALYAAKHDGRDRIRVATLPLRAVPVAG